MQGSQHRKIENVEGMYADPLQARRTGPLYNAFSYPTKISPEVIALFIATHTRVGSTVVDTFSGSGTTGVAAILSERPTQQMIDQAKRLGLTPTWGPRNPPAPAFRYQLVHMAQCCRARGSRSNAGRRDADCPTFEMR